MKKSNHLRAGSPGPLAQSRRSQSAAAHRSLHCLSHTANFQERGRPGRPSTAPPAMAGGSGDASILETPALFLAIVFVFFLVVTLGFEAVRAAAPRARCVGGAS